MVLAESGHGGLYTCATLAQGGVGQGWPPPLFMLTRQTSPRAGRPMYYTSVKNGATALGPAPLMYKEEINPILTYCQVRPPVKMLKTWVSKDKSTLQPHYPKASAQGLSPLLGHWAAGAKGSGAK